MELLFEEGLYRVGSSDPGQGFNYLLRRPEGNFLLLNLAGCQFVDIEDDFDALEECGGVRAQFVSDWHNAKTNEPDRITHRFGAPLYCSEVEAQKISKTGIRGLKTLPYEPVLFADDFWVIPTPGHTPGGVSHLWDTGRRRFLFVGDVLYCQEGTWQYSVSKANATTMRKSLERLRELEFDVLVSNSFGNTGSPFWVPGPGRKNELLDRVIVQLGGSQR